jgi:hypothetical protein
MIFFALLPPQVHELGYADCPKSYVFRGDKAVSPQQVRFFFVFSSSCSTLFGIVFSCLILKEFDNFLVMLLEGEG